MEDLLLCDPERGEEKKCFIFDSSDLFVKWTAARHILISNKASEIFVFQKYSINNLAVKDLLKLKHLKL